MKQHTEVSKIKNLMSLINDSLTAIEQQKAINFHKDSIKNACIAIHQSVQLIEEHEEQHHTHEIETPAVIETKKELIVEKTPIETLPVVETPIKIEAEVLEPVKTIVEEPVKPSITEPKKEEPVVKKTPVEKQDDDDSDDQNDGVLTLNERLSKNVQPQLNIAEKLKETPISDIAKSIAISKKFEFINLLFDGKAEVYKNCIQTVQNSSSYNEAIDFIETNIVNAFDWQDHEKLAGEFFSFIRRRFIK